MDHADFVAQYRVPLTRADQPRPELVWSRPGEGRLRGLAGATRRRTRGRRLAYLDSHFPWQRSGFRYADALALHELRPDTVFFSMYELSDPFPAPVLPLAEFPRLAPSLGITDVYGVFLGFMAGILGLDRHTPHEPDVIEGLDLSAFLVREGIRAHAGLYPGGGFVATEAGFERSRRLVAAAETVFTWSPAALAHVDGMVEIAPSIIDTDFYAPSSRDFSQRPLQLLFAADSKPRKGLAVALAAMAALDSEPVHLHVVGPHDPADWGRAPERVTFHGWCSREQLRALHHRCHVFLSPVSAERPGDAEGDGGITDGFPTASAAEAASSGLLLVSANPDADHRHLRPGVDYVETEATSESVAAAVGEALADPETADVRSRAGAARVRERLCVRRGTAERLSLMGIHVGRTPWRPARAASAAAPAPGAPAQTAPVTLPAELQALSDRLAALHAGQERLAAELREARLHAATQVAELHEDVRAMGQLTLDDETAVADALQAVRMSTDYELPFSEPEPLVTICVPTYRNYAQLIDRSLPSVLSQDYPNIEVIVIGDGAPPETGAAIAELDDPRVRYENLTVRGPYPDDPHRRWMVAGTGALNRGLELARGSWIVINNDDDALRPHHISTLLPIAREERIEVVYGRLLTHSPDGEPTVDGVFPPESHGFGWQLAVQHRALRMFRYKLAAALFDCPGDWDRARRMLRAGVSFRMVDEIVFDYYPGTLWRDDPLPDP